MLLKLSEIDSQVNSGWKGSDGHVVEFLAQGETN